MENWTLPVTPASLAHTPFEIVPGVGIGPFRLGMTAAEIDALCRVHGLENKGTVTSGLGVRFREGRAVEIEFEASHPLALAGEVIASRRDDYLRPLVGRIAPGAEDWTNIEGLLISHYEQSDDFVFAFAVYEPGFRRGGPARAV